LAREDVRINHFNVGWVLTANELKTKIKDGLSEEWLRNPPRTTAPSGKLLTPDQIAAAAVYWLSDESRPITGSVLELEQYAFVGFNPSK
jgi:NAD(P)-dependent dehydrogenase (short-subunit alcohol dehydrogenase family)